MKKNLVLGAFALALSLPPATGQARQGFSIGMGPIGNIFVIDTIPVLDPGVGGYVFFNYRFQEQLAFEATFLLSAQDGTDVSAADRGILFLGMPTFDIKLYFLSGDPRWDPYLATGIGVYWLTEGRVENDTGGVGLGAQLSLGFDYYLTEMVSVGFSGTFRSIGIITDLGTPSLSNASFPYTLAGNVAFHF